jgi:penicillin-binding protein A
VRPYKRDAFVTRDRRRATRPSAILLAVTGAGVVSIGAPSIAAADTSGAIAAALCASDDGPARVDRVRLDTVRRDGARYLADLDSGAIAELTLDPRLQAATEGVLRKLHNRYGASVVLSIPDGRVLALAGSSSIDATLGAEELALRPWAPAASVFKIVSAAALIDEAGLTGDTRTCYHGGVSAVLPDNLIDNPRIDRACATLAYGIGKSQNAILAKLAVRHLLPAQLARTGRALGFDEALGFDLPLVPSHLDVPQQDPLEFARTAAGFWHSTLSPMHGALLAAAIANGGQMVTPRMIERTWGSAGVSAAEPGPPPRQVLSPNAAAEVAAMMAEVTRVGTARAAFHDRLGRSRLPISTAGKTGTLFAMTDRGAIGYSWFVGFAPVERPTIAFAVALGNRPGRRLKASQVARELLAEYVAEGGMTLPASASSSEASPGQPPRRGLRPARTRADAGHARRGGARRPGDLADLASALPKPAS